MRKYILFIVEGENDKKELEAILHTSVFSPYEEKYKPFVIVLNGDMSTKIGINENNVLRRIEDIVTKFRKSGVPFSNISVSDIQEIVQIVDLDGAYVSYPNIIKGESPDFEYTEDAIITSNVDGLIGRNKKKTKILNKLVDTKQIGSIPYSVYYVSCNMDHVLFEDIDPTREQKRERARSFQIKCQENEMVIYKTIFDPVVQVDSTYIESWNYVKGGCESLHRHTNLNLFFSDKAKNIK